FEVGSSSFEDDSKSKVARARFKREAHGKNRGTCERCRAPKSGCPPARRDSIPHRLRSPLLQKCFSNLPRHLQTKRSSLWLGRATSLCNVENGCDRDLIESMPQDRNQPRDRCPHRAEA